MRPTHELAVMLVGLVIGGLITAAIVRLILPAWWRRYDRKEQRR